VNEARTIRELRDAVRRAGPELRATSVEARAAAIERACASLLDHDSARGRALRLALEASTGLSSASIEHGLRTTLGAFLQDGLLALHASRPARSQPAPELATVVLAGNVFSAAARPLLLPLLCGCPVLAKAASHDDVFPRALQRAVGGVDPALGAACGVVTFSRDDAEQRAALLAGVEMLTVYGDDETIAELRALVPAETAVVAHGHGLGVAFVAGDVLDSEQHARVTASMLARDVAAYDQRGCLSPHGVFLQRGKACDAKRFAKLLADELDALATSWPRGTLPAEAAADQLQWRGVAAATGELYARESCAVSYAGELPLRASPGYRNVAVHDVADIAALRARLAPLSVQLKALGVGSAGKDLAILSDTAPYVCAIGSMQEPPLDATLDGLHPLTGF
jgi:hypothetical protein